MVLKCVRDDLLRLMSEPQEGIYWLCNDEIALHTGISKTNITCALNELMRDNLVLRDTREYIPHDRKKPQKYYIYMRSDRASDQRAIDQLAEIEESKINDLAQELGCDARYYELVKIMKNMTDKIDLIT